MGRLSQRNKRTYPIIKSNKMKKQTIKIKFNDVLFRVNYENTRYGLTYSIYRNKKMILAGHFFPKKQKADFKMMLFRQLSENISWEIKHELEKLSI